MATWNIDQSHSSINFSLKHMMIAKVHGAFEKFSGNMHFKPQNPELLKVEAKIETSSINTRESQRDTHLKSPEFFDVEKYPQICFSSTEVQEVSKGHFRIQGELTIHGITKIIPLEVEGLSKELKDPWGNSRMGLTATTKIKRKDFGLTWNTALEAGGVLVGDDVSITLEVQFVRQA